MNEKILTAVEAVGDAVGVLNILWNDLRENMNPAGRKLTDNAAEQYIAECLRLARELESKLLMVLE